MPTKRKWWQKDDRSISALWLQKMHVKVEVQECRISALLLAPASWSMHALEDTGCTASLRPASLPRLLQLPPELLETLFAYCDVQSVGFACMYNDIDASTTS